MPNPTLDDFLRGAKEDNPGMPEWALRQYWEAKYAPSELPKVDGEKRSWTQFGGDMALKAAQGVVGLGQAVVGLGDIATGGMIGQAAEAVGYEPKRANEILSGMQSDKQKRLDVTIGDAGRNKGVIDGFVDTLGAIASNPSAIPGMVVESLPSMLAAGGGARKLGEMIFKTAVKEATAAGATAEVAALAGRAAVERSAGALKWAAAAGEGALTAGQTADQARDEGRSWSQYVLPSLAAGTGTALIGRAMGSIPGMGDAETAFFTGVSKAAATGNRFARGIKGSIQEGIEEALQSPQEQAFSNVATGKPVEEGVGAAAAQGLAAGVGMGGPMGLASRAAPDKKAEEAAAESARIAAEKKLADDRARREAEIANIGAAGSVDEAIGASIRATAPSETPEDRQALDFDRLGALGALHAQPEQTKPADTGEAIPYDYFTGNRIAPALPSPDSPSGRNVLINDTDPELTRTERMGDIEAARNFEQRQREQAAQDVELGMTPGTRAAQRRAVTLDEEGNILDAERDDDRQFLGLTRRVNRPHTVAAIEAHAINPTLTEAILAAPQVGPKAEAAVFEAIRNGTVQSPATQDILSRAGIAGTGQADAGRPGAQPVNPAAPDRNAQAGAGGTAAEPAAVGGSQGVVPEAAFQIRGRWARDIPPGQLGLIARNSKSMLERAAARAELDRRNPTRQADRVAHDARRQLWHAIVQAGGVSEKEAADIGIDPRSIKGYRLAGFITPNGMRADILARTLAENGYLTPKQMEDGGDEAARQVVADLLAREFVGDEGQRQRYMELLAEHHAAKDIRETGAEALPAVDLADVADYDDSGVVAEAVEELNASPMSLEDAMRTLGFSEEEIQNARKPGDQGGAQETRSDEPGSPTGGGQTGDGQAAPRTVGEGGESGDREGEAAVVEAERKSAPLYASRPVTNAGDIIAWAHSQGFKTTLPAEDLHVTVAYSTAPMDGATVPATGKSIKVAGDKRSVETLGDEGAVVLKFSSKALQVRWQQYRDAGASWDYDGYQPHITLTYDGQGVDLSKVEPYRGAIVLGAETQEALNEDKADEYVEAPTPEQPAPTPVAESQAPQKPSGDTDATLARFKPREMVIFAKPFVGKTGAKLTGYQWVWTKVAEIDKRGEDRVIRVSDWERAMVNPETNREIVHQFQVVDTNGDLHVVSAETAAKMLGVAQSTVRTNAVKLVEQQIREQEERDSLAREADRYDAMKAMPTPAQAIENGDIGYAEIVRKRALTDGKAWGAEQDRYTRDIRAGREYRFLTRDGKFIFSPAWVASGSELAKRGWETVELKARDIWDADGNDKRAPEAGDQESLAPQDRTYLAVPFQAKEFAKNHGARWDAERKLWFAVPIATGMAKGEIPQGLQQFIPVEHEKPEHRFYKEEAVATVVALNMSARTGVPHKAVRSKTPDGAKAWAVVESQAPALEAGNRGVAPAQEKGAAEPAPAIFGLSGAQLEAMQGGKLRGAEQFTGVAPTEQQVADRKALVAKRKADEAAAVDKAALDPRIAALRESGVEAGILLKAEKELKDGDDSLIKDMARIQGIELPAEPKAESVSRETPKDEPLASQQDEEDDEAPQAARGPSDRFLVSKQSGRPVLTNRYVELGDSEQLGPNRYGWRIFSRDLTDEAGDPLYVGFVIADYRDSKFTALHRIEVDETLRGRGLGETVVASMLRHNGPGVRMEVNDIEHAKYRGTARDPLPFWRKMGVTITNFSSDPDIPMDGFITLEDYRDARQSGNPQADRGVLGEDAQARRDRDGAPQEGREGRAEAIRRIRSELVDAFGEDGVAALEASGLLHITTWDAAPADLTNALRSGDEGAYWPGHGAWIFADNIDPADAVRIALHEIGEHFGLKSILGEQRFGRLLDQVKTLHKAGNPEIAAAWRHVARNYGYEEGSELFMREVIAKAGESARIQGMKWWQRLLDAVRAWALKHGFAKLTGAEDLNILLHASVKAAMREAGGAVAVNADGVMAARLHHGTPHDVERFSIDKIGTGEGAQAYGWGLYFAENAGVAESYARKLSRGAMEVGGRVIPRQHPFNRTPESSAVEWVVGYGSVEKAIERLRYEMEVWPHLKDRHERSIEVLQSMSRQSIKAATPKQYTVDIPDEVVGRMLLWDKPLSEQPKTVRATLEQVRQGLEDAGMLDDYLERENAEWGELTGAELYKQILNRAHLDDVLGLFDFSERPYEAASKYLDSIGIPGIKYLDGNSRSDGQGTNNVVVFNDKYITITHKDGKEVNGAEHEAFVEEVMASSSGEPPLASRSAIKSVEANADRGRDAMNKAILDRADVSRAMWRSDLGWIDFVWGDAKKGLAHIYKRRMDVDGMSESEVTRMLTQDVVDVIARGETERRIESAGSVNLRVTDGNVMAVLVKNPGSNGWLLSGFEVLPPGERRAGFDAAAPTRPTPTPTRREGGAGEADSVAPLASRPSLFDTDIADPAPPAETKTFVDAMKDGVRPVALGAFTRQQLAEMYGRDMPEVEKYDELQASLDAQRSNLAQDADKVLQSWRDLPKATADSLADIMHDATLAQFDPDTGKKGTGFGLPVAQQTSLQNRFNGLGDEAKAVYRRARDMYQDRMGKLFEALAARIQRSGADYEATRKTVDQLRQLYDGYLKNGPYFPLARFGDYLLIAVNKKDADDRMVMSFESARERDKQATLMRAKGYRVKSTVSREYSRARDGSAGPLAEAMSKAINELDFDTLDLTTADGKNLGDMKGQLLDELNQAFIRGLPELSYRKHFVHRKGTPGFSKDAMRAFADSMLHSSSQIAKMGYGDQMTRQLDDMQKAIAGEEEGDLTVRQQVLNEMVKRHDLAMNHVTHPVAAMLGQLGFVMSLGASVASGVVNLTQTPLVTMPYLGAKFGWDKATAALTRAAKRYAQSPWEMESGFNAAKNATLSADQRDMLTTLEDRGKINTTMAHDLAGASSTDNLNQLSKYGAGWQKIMRALGWTFHVPEVANRQITALATYDLARQAGQSHAEAIEAAGQAIDRTHFNYEKTNRARYFEGNFRRVLLMFKQYGQNIAFLYGRAAYQALKGATPAEKREARRLLTGMVVTQFTAAGALGLPFIGTAAALLTALANGFRDDDEEWDWEVEFRKMLAANLGKTAGEAIAHGLPRLALGWDLSGRIGQNDLFIRAPNREQEGRDAYYAWMQALAGPVGGYAANLYLGGGDMVKGMKNLDAGHMMRGAEELLPTFIRNPLKAARYEMEDVRSRAGQKQIELGGLEKLGQALGFTPTRVAEMYEGMNAVKNAEHRISERRKELLDNFARSVRDRDLKDRAKVMEAVREFNQRHPSMAIRSDTLQKSVQGRQKREAGAKDGLYLPRNREFLRQEGAFANL